MPAATGTLLAAALETAGYQAQSIILQDFGPMLTGIATVLFIGSAISGLITIGLLGQYRMGLWFLIGPAMFYFLVNPTEQAAGVDWQFGTFDGDEGVVEQQLGYTVNARVPFVFHGYNQLISGLSQEFIKVLTDRDLKKQLKFMARQRMMDEVFRGQIENPGLMALIHRGLKGDCYSELNAARLIAQGNRDPLFRGTPEFRKAAQVYYHQRSFQKIGQNTPEYTYLYDLLTSVRQAQAGNNYDLNCQTKAGFAGDLNIDYTTAPISEVLNGYQNCAQIWCWTGIGVAREAGQMMKDAENKFVDKYAAAQYPDVITEIWHNIAVKLSPLTIQGAPPPDVSLVPVIISGILLRKALADDARSTMYARLADHSGVYTKPYNFTLKPTQEQIQDITQRMQAHTQAVSERYDVFIFAMVIPYVQGILLYGLAVAFPFFAVLVVIPGKATSFFAWFALWAWVKLWDVGWALVMVIDDVLWELMPHTAVFNPGGNPAQTVSGDPNHGAITIFESAFQHDPAYSLANYYTLLGVMIMGVPMVSGQMILGAKAAIGGILLTGMKAMGEKLSGSVADWVAHDQIYKIDYLREKFALDYVDAKWKAAQAGQMATEALQKQKAETESSSSGWSSFWKGVAWVGAGIAVVAVCVVAAPVVLAGTAVAAGATAVTAAVGGTAVVVGTGVAGAGLGYSAYKSGKNIERAGSAAVANLMTENFRVSYYEAGKQQEFRAMDQIRAGLSTRGEFWNLMDAPADNAANMANIENRYRAQLWHENAFGAGSVVRAVYDVFSKSPD